MLACVVDLMAFVKIYICSKVMRFPKGVRKLIVLVFLVTFEYEEMWRSRLKNQEKKLGNDS